MKYALCIPRSMAHVEACDTHLVGAVTSLTFPFVESMAREWAEEAVFRPRSGEANCEVDTRVLQIIPYIVVFRHDDDLRTHVLSYSRQPLIDEHRLAGKRSIGIGGHIEPSDFDIPVVGDVTQINPQEMESFDPETFWQLCRAAALREISEELGVDTQGENLQCHTMIYDNSQEVGKVHLGVICTYYLPGGDIRSQDSELYDARFEPLADLRSDDIAYENWSKMTIKEIQGWTNGWGLTARQLVGFHRQAFAAILPASNRTKHLQNCRGNSLWRLENLLQARTFSLDGKVYEIGGETIIEKTFKEIP